MMKDGLLDVAWFCVYKMGVSCAEDESTFCDGGW